jgi:hypothetical protein
MSFQCLSSVKYRYMHILVAGHVDDVQRVFEYCDQYGIVIYYGQVEHEFHEFGWQILHESCARLDILMMLFPGTLQVLRA